MTVNQAVAQLYYIHTDHLNTPRAIYNQTQQLVWRWDNADPFGGNLPDENPSGLGNFTCNLRLPGQYFDRETNLTYTYFRDYDPGIGRYVQSDPMGLADGLNSYAYTNANPLVRRDPLGLWSTDAHNYFLYRWAARRFPDIATLHLKALYQGSEYADSEIFHADAFSFMHNMSSSLNSPIKGQEAMCRYVKRHLELFKALRISNPEKAYFHLGMAMHPVMDSTSPLHRGFQKWSLFSGQGIRHGLFDWWPFSKESLRHARPFLGETIELMNKAMDGKLPGCEKCE